MKKLSILMLAGASTLAMTAQNPMDAYKLSQYDLRGTARFVSMAGAFGALGADLSTLSQNPGGIGVYRSGDVGITLGMDFMSSSSDYNGYKRDMSHSHFNVQNAGAVATLRLKNDKMPNLNLGFSYNRAASFNRRYQGGISSLKTSFSNYIAGIANTYCLTEADVRSTDSYNPYNPGVGDRYVPWSAIIGYDSYLINPEGDPENPHWAGQFGNGTTGNGFFNVRESGYLDEYNIVIGGNIANKVFWGMNFDIVDVNYTVHNDWQENMENAYVYDPDAGQVRQQSARWVMDNLYNLQATGFNYQLGVIVRPIQEIRFGLAFHTPTFFNVTENYAADQIDYKYSFASDYAMTDDGNDSFDKVKLQTPWKVIASLAGVIGSKGIISVDYEWQGFKKMKFKEYYGGYYSYWDDDYTYGPTAVQTANESIRTIFKNSSTLRVGAEYRVLPKLSIRAGYSHTWSPVTSEAQNGMVNIPSMGTLGNYTLDNDTDYVTAGLGFRTGGFYIDAAYVYKHQSSVYAPFAPDPDDIAGTYMPSKLSFSNSQIVLSAGFKF